MIGHDNLTGPEPALDDVDLQRVVRALASPGVSVVALARAYGVSARTMYRYRGCTVEHHTIGGQHVAYLCRPGRKPVPVTARRVGRPAFPNPRFVVPDGACCHGR